MYTSIYNVSLPAVIIIARVIYTGSVVYGYLVKPAPDIGGVRDMVSHRRAAAPVLPRLAERDKTTKTCTSALPRATKEYSIKAALCRLSEFL